MELLLDLACFLVSGDIPAVLVCKDIELRYGRTKTKHFFSTVRVVSLSTSASSINLLKDLFIKF